MAEYSGFNDFLSIDGTDVSAYLRDVEYGPTIETADVTAGSGVTHRKRNTALKDSDGSMTFIYDDAFFTTLAPLIEPGEHTIIWGPEGDGSGKPKLEMDVIITDNSLSGNYEQTDARVFSVSFVQAAAPTTDPFDGGTFS